MPHAPSSRLPRPRRWRPVESTVVNSGVYRDGERIASPSTLAEALSCLPDSQSMAWIGMYRPDDAQLYAAAQHFDLHELAVEDAIVAHQRPKLERYGKTLFVVLRAARYRRRDRGGSNSASCTSSVVRTSF